MKTGLVVAIAGLGLGLTYLALWPTDIDPEAWDPPTFAPDQWTPTGGFEPATRVPIRDGYGPEDIEVDAEGRIYAGLHDGRILRWDSPDNAPQELARTDGRPLGLHWDPQGRLLVADAFRGLLRLNPGDGPLETLTSTCGGRPLIFTDDLEITRDGTIYFTDASVRFDMHRWQDDILENRPSGRLCRWREGDDDATEVLTGLHFANGVAIDPAERFVLVNETARYRVRRFDLHSGSVDVLIDNLPGFPDGISTGAELFWIAIASPRNSLLDRLAPSPFLRRVVHRLPEFLKPKPEHTSRVLGIDAQGQVVVDLFDPRGTKIALVTSVQERNERLYFGSLSDDAFAFMPSPAGTPTPASPP